MDDDMVTIETYKGVPIKYGKDNGKIYFEYEGSGRRVDYIFEARDIIDHPRWVEAPHIEGYWIKSWSTAGYIGKAISRQKDAKSGKRKWLYQDKEESRYLPGDTKETVYPRNAQRDKIYKEWAAKEKKLADELRHLRQLAITITYKTNE